MAICSVKKRASALPLGIAAKPCSVNKALRGFISLLAVVCWLGTLQASPKAVRFSHAYATDSLPNTSTPLAIPDMENDSISTVRTDSIGLEQKAFEARKDSLLLIRRIAQEKKDSIRSEQMKRFTYVDTSPFKDSLAIYYWRISENLGEFRPTQPDTLLSGFPARRYVDGMGTSLAYLGNTGTPVHNRIFSEREASSHFMFADAYYIYNRTPSTFNFINTRLPYSNVTYETEGGGETKNERLDGAITVNLNKQLNLGIDVNYLYARGSYLSQGAKQVDLVLYSSYFSDKYRYHFFYNNRNFVNAENGGITDDRYITSPDAVEETQNMNSKDIPTHITDTWNRIRGSQFYFTHRYNVGFEKETGRVDTDGYDITQFVPIASLIHTANLQVQSHKFTSNYHYLDTLYAYNYYEGNTVDTTRTFRFKNTLGLSLREGFTSWAKFDLTAYASFDYRQYLLMERIARNSLATQHATYIGGELSSSANRFFTYYANAEFGVLGENVGDVNLEGRLTGRIPLWNDTAAVSLQAYVKNQTPSFYEKHYHSKYFWWDNDFDQTQRVFVGGEIAFPHTKSSIKLGVENVSNYVYFNQQALPQQHSSSIQVLSLAWLQKIRLGVLHCDNEFTYQKSAKEAIIPLPELSVNTNLYLNLHPLPVLNMQLGTQLHYFSKYYAPSYEPATQQFHLQEDIKIGNYPLMSAYVNCKLHQVRFFINFYNISSKFVKDGAYFSLPHYPLKPMTMKLGLSIDLNN